MTTDNMIEAEEARQNSKIAEVDGNHYQMEEIMGDIRAASTDPLHVETFITFRYPMYKATIAQLELLGYTVSLSKSSQTKRHYIIEW